ncbi:metallophosphoesterase [Leptolyngbya sp. FACHB-261]|uniref:metallophosphoesterase family protein n=1 Tax=Leptolyngbya sp. FACHB-261 TaxID=2692806 RepID=UPI0016826DE9|nr:metallophosphoesterase [Leptolyngbya sp. FACHB-261]MBD2101339.1 metallophosphoesterase [Leptolyngbya sp. FACHB-261]
MSLNFRFAVVSDLHLALPQTIRDTVSRFHLVEVSVAALEQVLAHLVTLELDFLLLPGDLTQDGEPENHHWLAQRLQQLPFPTYVIPGNHDLVAPVELSRFAGYYRRQGYQDSNQPYYACLPLPGLRLIGLNSNAFCAETGRQLGRLDDEQLRWLEAVLNSSQSLTTLVMVHHNVLEHLPGQASNPLGRRYLLENADTLTSILRRSGVKLVFTGHLHAQDIAHSYDLYDITTGSLVSYPHPYRVLTYRATTSGAELDVDSHRVEALPDWPTLQQTSREWMGQHSASFMLKLLTQPPLNLSIQESEPLLAQLRYFWATVAAGDARFSFPDFPAPVRQYFERFNDLPPADNQATLQL